MSEINQTQTQELVVAIDGQLVTKSELKEYNAKIEKARKEIENNK